MTPTVSQPLEGRRQHLHYLDGMRGLAALWVVLHHAYAEVRGVPGWMPESWIAPTRWALNGRVGVDIFIALSGYCLMMPVVQSGALKGGEWSFIKRRARRILPPYYAALGLTLLVDLLVPGMNVPQGLRWDATLPATTWPVVASHLLLLQDLERNWIFKVSYPMWTIAQEWHIYFIFALLLLPIRRRLGILAAAGFAAVVAVALRHVPGYDFSFAAPELLFLFSMGMLAANINFAGSSEWLAGARDKLPWGWMAAGCWVAYVVSSNRQLGPHPPALSFAKPLIAAAMLTLLVFCTRAAQERKKTNLLVWLLERNFLIVLGTFSYSLYLIHAPILGLFSLYLHPRGVPGSSAMLAQLLIAVPVTVAAAYGFHLAAERPFMLGRPRSLPQTEKAAVLDTAP